MGEVIRRGAAATDILADVSTTVTKADAKGGDWKKSADERLGAILKLADGVDQRINQVQDAAAAAKAKRDQADEAADDLLGKVSDEIWNDVGRPGQDPALDILFPGGISYYARGSLDGQPERMDLLAELLRAGVHPRLPAAAAEKYAKQIEDGASSLRAAADAYRPLQARLELAKRMQSAIARQGQIALSRLKALWKSDGRSEADIHSIIPDRPRPSAKAPAEQQQQAAQ